MNSSSEAPSGPFAVGLLSGGKCFGMSHLNPVLVSFLAVNADNKRRDRVQQGKYLWEGKGSINVIEQVMGKASSARCGSWYVHSIKLFQTAANEKKGSGMMQETRGLSWEETDRIEKLFGLVNMSAHKPQREKVVPAKAYYWRKNKGV